jgi:hypothetical protein
MGGFGQQGLKRTTGTEPGRGHQKFGHKSSEREHGRYYFSSLGEVQ